MYKKRNDNTIFCDHSKKKEKKKENKNVRIICCAQVNRENAERSKQLFYDFYFLYNWTMKTRKTTL